MSEAVQIDGGVGDGRGASHRQQVGDEAQESGRR